VVCIIDGVRTGTAFRRWFGHEKRRTRRAGDERIEEAPLLLGRTGLAEQIHVALVRRHRVAGERTKGREPRADQDVRGFALVQVAAIGQDTRG
jgi:hypothetical protein